MKRVVLKSVPDETTRAAALKRGEVVRLAASLAIDRKAINEAEALGFSGLTGNIVPRHMEFALPIEPHPYDPKRAKQLLTEAGYPNGFDAGDITPNPPYFSMAEAIGTNLGAVGIKARLRTLERAAFLTAWGEKKLKGIVLGAPGAGGNAATRIEGVATRNGTYAYGVLPEVEDLFLRQARELDRKRREEMLHQIQRILHERVVFAPIWENGFIRGVGPRAEEPAPEPDPPSPTPLPGGSAAQEVAAGRQRPVQIESGSSGASSRRPQATVTPGLPLVDETIPAAPARTAGPEWAAREARKGGPSASTNRREEDSRAGAARSRHRRARGVLDVVAILADPTGDETADEADLISRQGRHLHRQQSRDAGGETMASVREVMDDGLDRRRR